MTTITSATAPSLPTPCRARPAAASLLLAPLLLLAASAGPATAQDPPERERECVCLDEVRDRMARVITSDRRARLGVMLGEDTTVDGRAGVGLADVRDGSPAHRAGLRAGDVVVALNGTPLGDDASGALLRGMRDIEPGDTVQVTYRRDGTEQVAAVITEAGPAFAFFGDGAGRLRAPGAPDAPVIWARPSRMERRLEPRAPQMLARALRRDHLALAPVNPQLGRYFGTDRGVLVLRIDEDSRLGLQPGDVILEIGDREIRDAAHARRILASYNRDEEVRLRVIRDQRTIDVTGQVTPLRPRMEGGRGG